MSDAADRARAMVDADAFRAALGQWPHDGTPDDPFAWLVSAGLYIGRSPCPCPGIPSWRGAYNAQSALVQAAWTPRTCVGGTRSCQTLVGDVVTMPPTSATAFVLAPSRRRHGARSGT